MRDFCSRVVVAHYRVDLEDFVAVVDSYFVVGLLECHYCCPDNVIIVVQAANTLTLAVRKDDVPTARSAAQDFHFGLHLPLSINDHLETLRFLRWRRHPLGHAVDVAKTPWVRGWVRAWVGACVRAWVGGCVRACVHVRTRSRTRLPPHSVQVQPHLAQSLERGLCHLRGHYH